MKRSNNHFFRIQFVGVVLAVFVAVGFPARAADLKSQIDAARADVRAHHIPKVSDSFYPVRKLFRTKGITRSNARTLNAWLLSNPLVKVSDEGSLHSYIYVTALSTSEIAILEGKGVQIEFKDIEPGIIQAWIPADVLEDVAALGFVTKIEPPHYAISSVGSKMTEGDTVLSSNIVRVAGFDGTGAKVGIISGGADHLNNSVALGDLPAGVPVHGICTVTSSCNDDEGTAMLEIVHDIAPGALLYFGGPNTDVEFRTIINTNFVADGVHIVVDDLYFPAEPIFQDGLNAQAVATEISSGTLHVSAADNFAQENYQADYYGGSFFGGNYHNFGKASGGADDFGLTVSIAPFGTISVVLQWNDQWGLSNNDYDLILYNNSFTTLLISSPGTQNGDDDPIEGLVYTNPSSSAVSVNVIIRKYSGNDKRINVLVHGDINSPIEYINGYYSIAGHAAVVDNMTVGAINASDPGNDTIAPYSSRGPVQIYYPPTSTRQKPDVAAIDGVAITGVGGFPPPSPGTFYGTSAAAPHVAGIAALLRGGLSTSSSAIRSAIKNTAVDLGVAGYDNIYGYGRVDAFAAAKSFNQPPNSSIVTPSGNITIGQNGSTSFQGGCTDSNSTTGMTYEWDFEAGSGVSASTQQVPGSVAFHNLGTFNVAFTCRDGFGDADLTPASISVTVVPNDPPDSAIVTPTREVTVNKNETVSFTGSCTDPNSTAGMMYQWQFGGGSGVANSTLQNPGAVAFPNTGVFFVSFACIDGVGAIDPTPASIGVTVLVAPTENVTTSSSTTTSAGGGCTAGAGDSGMLCLLVGAFGLLWRRRFNAEILRLMTASEAN